MEQGGPQIFVSRLKRHMPDYEFMIFNPNVSDIDVAKRKRYEVIGRLDGLYYYDFTVRNLFGYIFNRFNYRLPFYDFFSGCNFRTNFFNKQANLFLNRTTIWLLENSDGLVFQSRLSLDFYRHFYPNFFGRVPVTVIHNGVDINEFDPGKKGCISLEGNPAVVISASSYRLHKRLHNAVDIVNRMRVHHPGVKLHVLGNLDNLSRESLEERDLSSVHFHGKINHTDLPKYYAACDFMLHLCLFDACPNVVAEALASGLPVISPLESGAAELVGECGAGWLVKENLKFDYYELHSIRGLPETPVDKYVDVCEMIYSSLQEEKNKARNRASDFLSIDKVAVKYREFQDEVFSSRKGVNQI